MTSEGVLLFIVSLAIQLFVMAPIALLSWFAKRSLTRVEESQREIFGEVHETNNRLAKVEQKIEDHLRDDERNFARIDNRIDAYDRDRNK